METGLKWNTRPESVTRNIEVVEIERDDGGRRPGNIQRLKFREGGSGEGWG